MSLVVKVLFIISVGVFPFSQAHAWETLTEMLEEARLADGMDSTRLGARLVTKEDALAELIKEPPESVSALSDLYGKNAMALIDSVTEFYGEGVEVMTPWTSIAYATLGTEDTKKCLIGLVALADIRGLPTFRTTLDKILSGVSIEEEKNPNEITALVAKFAALRISS